MQGTITAIREGSVIVEDDAGGDAFVCALSPSIARIKLGVGDRVIVNVRHHDRSTACVVYLCEAAGPPRPKLTRADLIARGVIRPAQADRAGDPTPPTRRAGGLALGGK